MNLADISKLKPAMQRAALADQERATAARERIMAQVGQPAKPVDMKLGHASFIQHTADAKVFFTHKQNPNSFESDTGVRTVPLPAKSPPEAISAQMQAILPQCPGVKVKQPKVSETESQQALVKWFDLHACEWNLEPELLMAFPLQGKRTKKSGARLKAEGMRKGTLDMLLAVPRGDCCSLWIEMKSSTGVLSEAQKLMLMRLTAAGSATVVCRSAQEAQAAIRCYLNLPTPTRK